jgi:capsular polysaccharide biosynthesis protein
VNDPDHALVWRNEPNGELSEHVWVSDDFTAVEELPADLSVRFTNFAYIRAALRRSFRLWCATAMVGLLVGCGIFLKYPPAYHSTTTVVLINSPNEDPLTEMETDATLAQSLAVAQRVVQQLGLRQSVESFVSASSVTVLTDQVLTITVAAPSANAAVARANALANAFLQYRAAYIELQQQELAAELNVQLDQAKQSLTSINAQLSKVSTQPSSRSQRAELRRLQMQSEDANNALDQIKQYVTGTEATSKTTTDSIIENSKILDPATPGAHSRKDIALDIAGGLVGGLALGMGIVAVGALVSDRLRRREEVAEAIDAPVRLTVGTLGGRRRLPSLPWRASKRDLDMKRVVGYLHGAVPGSSRGLATLAVVAVDDVRVTAQVVTSLAKSYASDHKQVVVADLSDGAHLAALLGVKNPGIHTVNANGTRLLVTVPERDDVAPVGPLQGRTSSVLTNEPGEALTVACRSADILLSMVTLDPAFDSEYLATWATDAVVMVTAGRSSEERIRGVGELIRLAGIRLDSVVLAGADKSDQSLGVNRTLDESMSFGLMG